MGHITSKVINTNTNARGVILGEEMVVRWHGMYKHALPINSKFTLYHEKSSVF